jgi:pimeloyl-ACP methyl ester carboxylesterase
MDKGAGVPNILANSLSPAINHKKRNGSHCSRPWTLTIVMTIRTPVRIKTLGFAIVITLLSGFNNAAAKDCVILLHGLARTASSMENLATAFTREGFEVVNVNYPSREHPVERLADMAVREGIDGCPTNSKLNFVTHSLGGILVRYYLAHHEVPRLGRVVMLGPPNKGSEVVDIMRDKPGYVLLNGPAGLQLGTDKDSIPMKLGAVNFELGVIAGTASINIILSQFLPNPDDGKVSVERTKVDGMRDFITVDRSHTFIMQASEVILQAISFIRNGKFIHDDPEN